MTNATENPTASRLDYRAFWTTDAPPGWTSDVAAMAERWLAPKMGGPISLTLDQSVQGRDGQHLDVLHHADGPEKAVRVTLDEENRAGHFGTALTVVENDAGGGWISLDVVSAEGGFVNRPRLAADLLTGLPLHDGARLAPSVGRITSAAAVDAVADAIQRVDRRTPVLVATTDERLPYAGFAKLIDEVTGELTGIAHVFVLNPAATVAFNRTLHPRWRTPTWTIRTYLPGVNLADPSSARASRILGTERLATDRDGYLRHLLGTVVRDAIGRRPAPAQWRAWRRTFSRLANDAVSASNRSDVATSVPTAAGLSDLERVQATLGLADLKEKSLLELLDRATGVDPAVHAESTARLRALQERLERAEDRLYEAQVGALIAEEERDRATSEGDELKRRVRYLTNALSGPAGRPDLAYGHTPDHVDEIDDLGSEPLTFAELADRLPHLEQRGVIFTGDLRKMLELAYLDADGKILQAAWNSFVSLTEYVRAKRGPERFEGSVHKFLEDQPAGYLLFPFNQHAATETAWTKTQYKGTREFPVPEEVARGGKVHMYEHFKLGKVAHQDPRIHYYDDTAGTGKIYVGYIGVHLINSFTET